MWKRHGTALILFFFSACSEVSTPGFVETSIDEVRAAAVCEESPCEIAWGSVLRVDPSPSDSVALGGPPWIDPQGRIWSGTYQRGELAVWNWDGELLRTIGEYGEGPGQFRGSGFFDFFAKADSILVRDNSSRITVLGPDLRFTRIGSEVGFGLSPQLVYLSGGAFLQIQQTGIALRGLDQELDPEWASYS